MMKSENRYFIFDIAEVGLKSILRKVYQSVQSVFFKMFMLMIHPNIESRKYNVAICAIFKNEAPYLKEWLEFNHLIGVEHFFMYNNNSDDNYMEILQPYIEKELVTLINWPYNQKQMECYKTCIKDYSSETKWLGFIDIDEFIVPKSTNNIYDFLKKFEKKAGAVNIYWRLFGSSGRIDRDLSGLVCEDFTVCWPKFCDIGKCFYNTAFGFDENSKYAAVLHHKFWANYKGVDIPPVNIFGHICNGSRNVADSDNFPIQINHYFTKSYREYEMKRSRGDVFFKINPHDEKYFYGHEMKCTYSDYSAYKYLVKLKTTLERKKSTSPESHS